MRHSHARGAKPLQCLASKKHTHARYTCQHRGRQLVDHDFCTRTRFVCPFHSWAYDLNGHNVRVTDREVFSERALCGDLNLKPGA